MTFKKSLLTQTVLFYDSVIISLSPTPEQPWLGEGMGVAGSHHGMDEHVRAAVSLSPSQWCRTPGAAC